MKKILMLAGLVVLTGAALFVSGCRCPLKKSCPMKGGGETELCGCGAPKGSAACAAACKK